jgi:hypothetical protein
MYEVFIGQRRCISCSVERRNDDKWWTGKIWRKWFGVAKVSVPPFSGKIRNVRNISASIIGVSAKIGTGNFLSWSINCNLWRYLLGDGNKLSNWFNKMEDISPDLCVQDRVLWCDFVNKATNLHLLQMACTSRLIGWCFMQHTAISWNRQP